MKLSCASHKDPIKSVGRILRLLETSPKSHLQVCGSRTSISEPVQVPTRITRDIHNFDRMGCLHSHKAIVDLNFICSFISLLKIFGKIKFMRNGDFYYTKYLLHY